MGNATPRTKEELEEVLADQKRLTELMGEPGKFKEFLQEYATAFYKHDPDLKGQLKEQMAEALKDFYDRNDVNMPEDALKRLPLEADAVNGKSPLTWPKHDFTRAQARQVAATGKGPGAVLNGRWETMGDFITSVANDIRGRQAMPDEVKALNENAGSEGGFLVPEEYRAELLRMTLEQAVVRPRARVVPMGSSSLKYPAIRDTSHATNVYGGIQGSWLAEAVDLSTVRTPAFQQIVLQAKKHTSYTVASNELLADSAVAMESLITDLFPEALAYFEDDAFITGTGAGQPLGILNADALVAISKESGQAATTFVYENAVKMFARMLPQSLNRAVWVMHPDVFPQLAVMSLSVGTGGSAVFMPSAVGGPPMSLFGRPIIFSEKAETLGTAGDVYFADFGFYLIGDRQQMELVASPHVRFTTDEMAWRLTQRVDGRPWVTSALTPRNGSNTMTPFLDTAVRS